MRLAVVTPQPTPYRDPFWNTVASQPGVELTVYYCRRGSSDRPWNITWELRFIPVFPRSVPVLPNGESYWNPGVCRLLKGGGYHALVLGGDNHLTMLAAAKFARRQGLPYYLMSEVYLAQPRSFWRRIVKTPVVRWVVRNARGWLPTGSLAEEYLVHYGAQPDRVCRVPNTPDLDSIRSRSEALLPHRGNLRKRLGWPEAPVILFVGRLLALKQVDTLIRACAKVFQTTPGHLVIAGDGPQRVSLERLATETRIGQRVAFCGFQPPEKLIELYTAADLFVLPSSDETWGVVVLEALACGLPVVVSDMVGCHPDVVVSKEIGDVVPACDVQALASAIDRRLRQPCRVPLAAWESVYRNMNYAAVAERLVTFIRETMPAAASVAH